MSVRPRSVLAAAAAVALLAAGCSAGSGDAEADGVRIGVTQIVTHPSLDLVVQGFKDALADAGIEATYSEHNAQGESSNAATIAGALRDDANLDLVLAVATPTAQAAVAAVTEIPVLFAAVTDPVSAELVPSWEASGTIVTGTSDLNPEARPLEMIREIVPGATTIGVLYSSSEVNSEVQVAALEEQAGPLGMTIRRSAITNSSEVATGAQALAGVDAIYIPTDNTVVSALEALVDFAQTNQIPLFSADTDSVSRGVIASRGVDYYALGRHTGEMAVRILTGEAEAGEIPTLVVTDTQIVVNPTAAASQGVTLGEELLAGAEVVGE